MLALLEQQSEIGVHASIEVQDPAEPESMMNILLEDKSDLMKVETLTTKLEDIDSKEVDDYMDLCVMENTDSVVKDQSKKEEIPEMMYEEDRLWNMEEITQWEYEYIISMDDNPQINRVMDDKEE